MSYVNSKNIVEIKRSHPKHRLNQHQLDCLHFHTFAEWFKENVSRTSNSLVKLNSCPCTYTVLIIVSLNKC